ncbi:hypothetical protein LINPERPRIM_LOCUS32783, partial [Linum perenne]
YLNSIPSGFAQNHPTWYDDVS